tara:strand:- start:2058 stop:2885 length:828 start_codon:yes stop_codon:yes gene_type:complete
MNKKNVIFWIGIKSQDPLLQEKHGGFKYLDVGRKSWEYWCKKNDVIFFPYETPSLEDTGAHRPTWQRWFDVFKQIEEAGIEYNKIAVIDGSTIIKWDAPSVFDFVPDGKVGAFRALENLRWITESIEGYEDFMLETNNLSKFEFDYKKYISCGFQIFDKSHKKFLTELKEFYMNNYDAIMDRQAGSVKKGTDQPVLNYFLQIKNVDVYTELPPPFLLTHLNRFDWFGHNWQLEGADKTPFFIKYGYIWFYSGFPQRGDRYNLMKQTWDAIKEKYV